MPLTFFPAHSAPLEIIFVGGAEALPPEWEGSALDGEYPVRPVGLAISPTDGALYVSSDNASVYQGVESPEQGALYRIARTR